MNFTSDTNNYSVKHILKQLDNDAYFIDESYQRRFVWTEGDQVRLIESLLNGYLIPPIYLWESAMDSETGDEETHIVDGQQRIKSIDKFIHDEFCLSEKYLSLRKPHKPDRYINKRFSELDASDKNAIRTSKITSIVLSGDLTIDDIKNIFVRLNLTNYSLNDQERRHAGKNGLFAQAARDIADAEFWDDHEIFTANDVKRMKEIEFGATLLLLARRGMIAQSNQKALNQAYDDYSQSYPECEEDKSRVFEWMSILSPLISDTTIGFVKKRTQLFSMFCFADYANKKQRQLNDQNISNFEQYVIDYNSFKNESSNSHLSQKSLELITGHKLASSEGIHKLQNRQIRLDMIKDAIFNYARYK